MLVLEEPCACEHWTECHVAWWRNLESTCLPTAVNKRGITFSSRSTNKGNIFFPTVQLLQAHFLPRMTENMQKCTNCLMKTYSGYVLWFFTCAASFMNTFPMGVNKTTLLGSGKDYDLGWYTCICMYTLDTWNGGRFPNVSMFFKLTLLCHRFLTFSFF